MITHPRIVSCFLFCLSCEILQQARGGDAEHYLNEWAAHIPGGARLARAVAEEHGFHVIRESPSLPDHYVFRRSDTPHRSRRAASTHTRSLSADHRVLFAEQQQLLARAKRGVIDDAAERREFARMAVPNDPDFSDEWYINQAVRDTRRRDLTVTDLRVRDVWMKGITGKNIVVTIIDDGLESNHTDLINNYDPKASYDFNANDDDPFPRYDPTNENKHGTRCAGVVSMSANNNVCGVGIAFNSKIGGIRMLDGKVNDLIEAQSLAFRNDHIHIFSASWGPTDDGMTLDGPRLLSGRAIVRGVTEGRGGKGTLYVWASGNGGFKGDCCAADGYASAIETIAVSSCTQDGNVPLYAERCPATLTTAYSSGVPLEGRVVSADLHNLCTNSHSGTSASAPMVAGILALLLEINPNITWRDAQHILVHTSRMEPLVQAGDWYTNGAGYCVNLAFGFGLVDALAVVQLGDPTVWKGVGDQHICEVEPILPNKFPYAFQTGKSVVVKFKTDGCAGQENEVNFLEHVKVLVSVAHQRRGSIYVALQSAMGTKTPLMLERKLDTKNKALKVWPLLSTHSWGERPQGTWTVRVADRNVFRHSGVYHGNVSSLKLVLYGTKHQPDHQKSSPRNCRVDQTLLKWRMKK
ncbi:hypothetical protein BsWGS_05016 [Bradybaena similaris]